jgi:CMP-N-acetylneuraminic acid synthetase
LTDLALSKIKQCKSFPQENFYLSAHEPELLTIGEKHNVNIYRRSKKSANSEGTPMTEMYEWWNRLPHKYCVLVNACAPFLKAETIDQFIEAYRHTDSDGMFGVIEKKNYFWNSECQLITPLTEAVMNTKTVSPVYEAAHCLYAGRLDRIGDGIWMGDFNSPGQIELFSMKEREVFDVDHEWQFTMAEKLLEAQDAQ